MKLRTLRTSRPRPFPRARDLRRWRVAVELEVDHATLAWVAHNLAHLHPSTLHASDETQRGIVTVIVSAESQHRAALYVLDRLRLLSIGPVHIEAGAA
jgi:hypothetical protein